MQHKVAYTKALETLEKLGQEFNAVFEHGTLLVELYKPHLIDTQNPHDRDEVYLIASGTGKFILENETTDIKAGDFLFVPSGATHKFIEFTEDFSTWVMFYGPKGGEKGTIKTHKL
jgi:mannose-6-phosphate isomerase-like protein (cupin superfamily)